MIVADTSVLIEFLRGNLEAEKLQSQGEITTCYPIECELFKGTRLARRTEEGKRQVKKLIERTSTLEADKDAAECFAKLKTDYPDISELDLMIASICVSHNVALITQDEDFEEIKRLDIVTLN